MTQQDLLDQRYMGLALALAENQLGRTAPNPSVGAVVVDQQSQAIISRGWTQPGGRPHAEAVALVQAGEDAEVGAGDGETEERRGADGEAFVDADVEERRLGGEEGEDEQGEGAAADDG